MTTRSDSPSQQSPTTRRGRLILSVTLLLILPIISVITTSAIERASGPRWMREIYDPDYVYLFNAMIIAEGEGPPYAYHPGTTVQSIGAGVLLTRNSGTSLRDEALDHPEEALSAISTVLRGIHFVALFTFGWWALRLSGSMLSAIAAQAVTLCSMVTLHSLHRVAPEPLLISVSLLLAAATMRALSRPGPIWTRYGIVSGLLMAVGVATKLTFAPIALLPAALACERGRHGWKLRIAGLLTGLVSLAVCLAPMRKGTSKMLEWFWSLLKADGNYGHSTGHTIINPDTYFQNLRQMVFAEPVTVIVAIAGGVVVLLALLSRTGRAPAARTRVIALGAVVAAQAAQYVLVAKHPGARYLLPAIGLSGLTVCLISVVARAMWPRMPAWAAGLVLAVAVSGAAMHIGQRTSRDLTNLRADTAARLEVNKAADAAGKQGAIIVSMYGTSSVSYGLFFSDYWAGFRYHADLGKRFPDFVQYDAGPKTFVSPTGVLPQERIQELVRLGRLLVCCPSRLKPPGFDWEPLTPPNGPEVLYRAKLAPANGDAAR